ncbi:MAG: PDZ domain-containing protein [Bacteroidota bacterium]
MKTRILFNFILMTVLAASPLLGQEPQPVRMQAPMGSYEFANQTNSTVIPFKLSENLIVIQVELNGKNFNLILDSGMPFDGAILFGSSKVDSTKIKFGGKMPIGGVEGQPILSDVSMGATLKVPNLTLSNQMILVMPYDPARGLRFEGKEGIIGFSFFAHLIVHINYDKQLITFSKPGSSDLADSGQMVPVEVRNGRILLKADVELEDGSKVPADLVVDTGNRSALSLNTGINSKISLPVTTVSWYATGMTSRIERKMGRINSLNLGGIQLNHVLVSFNDGSAGAPPPWEKEGNLGSQTLRRFNLTFNIPGGKMYFKKNQAFDAPFEFNLPGFQVDRTEDARMVVYHIISDSPADKSGIVPGDKIISVNGKPVSQLTKDEFEQEFSKSGSQVSILIDRSGKQISINLKPEKFI